MSKGVQIAGGATIVALLLGWYAVSNLEDATFAYYQNLDEFRASAPAGERARLHGYVVPGSIERDVPGRQVRFSVQNAPPHAGGAPGPQLAIVFASLETSDMFKDGAEVVVEGELAAGAHPAFHADKLFAKCPSKFEGQEPPGARSASLD